MGQYDQPEAYEAAATGDKIHMSQHVGALMCFRPTEEKSVVFKNEKAKAEKEGREPKSSLVVVCDIDIIEGGYMPESKKAVGSRLTGVWITGAMVAPVLAKSMGKEVLARVNLGEKGDSPQPPVILDQHTDDDIAKADAFYAEQTAETVPTAETSAPANPAELPSKLTPAQLAAIAAIMGTK